MPCVTKKRITKKLLLEVNQQIGERLSQYRAIEHELGDIDLVIMLTALINALKLKIVFYGKTTNEKEILRLRFVKLDYRPSDYKTFIWFRVIDSYVKYIVFDILEYGKSWSLYEEDLK